MPALFKSGAEFLLVRVVGTYPVVLVVVVRAGAVDVLCLLHALLTTVMHVITKTNPMKPPTGISILLHDGSPDESSLLNTLS